MWLRAAEAVQEGGGLLAAVITLAGLVVTGVVTVLVALINRGKSTPPPPITATPTTSPAPHLDDDDVTIRERIAVLEHRMDAKDHDDEVRDRRHDQVERHLDIDNPRWRSPR